MCIVHVYGFIHTQTYCRIKHCAEVEGKSTSSHARILAPDDVAIHIYPEVPHYQDTSRVLLLYPTVVRALLLYITVVTCTCTAIAQLA